MNKASAYEYLRWAGLMVFILAVTTLPAWAGAGGNEFDAAVAQLAGWATGGLGRIISLAAVIVGAIISVVRSNPLPILSGIAFAMILNFTPGIVTGLLTAVL